MRRKKPKDIGWLAKADSSRKGHLNMRFLVSKIGEALRRHPSKQLGFLDTLDKVRCNRSMQRKAQNLETISTIIIVPQDLTLPYRCAVPL